MNCLICLAIFAASLGAPLTQAQYYPQERGYARPYGANIFDRVQSDLDRAAHDSYPNGKLKHAFHELGEFRARYNSGRSAKHQLDNAISAVSDLVASNVLRPQDRDMLQNDVISMRQFREGYREHSY